ncbi:ABC transporter permease [Paraburkholderia haematera]|uniref:Histidine transport system permease protein HisQ n=1 Tax=Paraburkholderia haematera TaxID=2793077 RepID=A0ABN7LX68_9BURK|nr:ABC transporter permease [Paraburkholderia haematera]CAE6765662.1 Histidine transport system permease protein HisQ [Paraburkholderia haematera]
MYFAGFGAAIATGTWLTLKLAVLSLVIAFALGLVGASAKLSRHRVPARMGAAYTTLIRAVPDLVLMLLLFYSSQILLNRITDLLGAPQIDIDPFVAGVLTIGFIYGAYFTETFRGAFLGVPRGQLEAGAAYGMSGWQVFRRILFPQMMRLALPGIGNNWLVIVKATALVSIIGLSDLVKATQDAGKSSREFFLFALVAGAVFLAITTASNLLLVWLEARYAAGVRRVAA